MPGDRPKQESKAAPRKGARPGEANVAQSRRLLRVAFEDVDAFRQEYQRNLANGGVFVPTERSFELRDPVRVELMLAGSDAKTSLDGEIVHIVPPDMAGLGGTPGVAVQFLGRAHEVRARLEPLAAVTGTHQYRPADNGRRAAARARAHMLAEVVDLESGLSMRGRTRDLSRSGVLVAAHGEAVGVGRHVQITLEHPTSGERLELGGVVVRDIRSETGQVVAVGIQFDAPRRRQQEIERFVDDVQSVEHARRLGGIEGSIAELGVDGLIQTFARGSAAGTLTLRRGAQEAIVVVGGGLLRLARLAGTTGVKALVRLMRWKDGSFEFHARVDPELPSEPPLPVEVALLEAAHQLDELGRIDARELPPTARLYVGGARAGGEPLSKIEEAVLDLARAGSFTLERVVELIPESDPEIYAAVRALAERGAVRLDP
jgi:type IV pilus assembly protein PilZ